MPATCFLGSKRLGLRCLEALHHVLDGDLAAITIDDRADTRSVLDEFNAFAAAHDLPLTIATTRREAAQAITARRPRLCVVCGWYWIVEKRLLDMVPAGFVGIHFSALPKYRGGSPLVWQIINGEFEIGISLFSFSEGIDEGSIWAQHREPIGPDETIGDVLPRLEDAAVRLLRQNVTRMLDGTGQPTPQDNAQATYVPLRRPEDGLIAWSQPARAVHNFVRAQSRPYPGAFTFHDAQRVTVWRTSVVDERCDARPGEIVRVTSQGVDVACGDGRLVAITDRSPAEWCPAAGARFSSIAGSR